ncbi:MAG: RnfABCDGE type electron transport complex subunit D [Candidatus Thermoplasmatota archaeon]|nr:RnfABCDGE type electron transport complex subunit D [Candidatus Thermoplasmatota archaeon]
MEVSVSPHIKSDRDVRKIMLCVVLALIPSAIAGVYYFGYYALMIIVLSILSAQITELIGFRLMGKPIEFDGSAVVTGFILALILPPSAPLWIPVAGSAFAIAFFKILFGGLGKNIFNPAAGGRVFLWLSFTAVMASFPAPLDGTTAASPLASSAAYSYMDLFLGRIPGSIGETCKLAIVIGGIILIASGLIDYMVPLVYALTCVIIAFAAGADPLYHLLSGGLLFAAFFMATDYVTTPITREGRVIFAIGLGILTMTTRLLTGTESISFMLLFMNGLVPVIDRFIMPRSFGEPKKVRIGGKKNEQ